MTQPTLAVIRRIILAHYRPNLNRVDGAVTRIGVEGYHGGSYGKQIYNALRERHGLPDIDSLLSNTIHYKEPDGRIEELTKVYFAAENSPLYGWIIIMGGEYYNIELYYDRFEGGGLTAREAVELIRGVVPAHKWVNTYIYEIAAGEPARYVAFADWLAQMELTHTPLGGRGKS